MFRNVFLAAAVLAMAGCRQPEVDPGGAGGGAGGAGGGAGGGGEPVARSAKGNVRFKRSVRLTNDFAAALGLPADQVCRELGQYPCTTLVHPIALGGVDPYGVGLYEPLPDTSLATPLVVERVALFGCSARTAADLAAPAFSVIWRNVRPDARGRLDVESPAVFKALDRLYKRAVQRPPTAEEVDHLKALYRDVEAAQHPEPGKQWMTLSCFAVLTSVEALFY